MYVPVNIQFYQEWLRLTAELTVAIDDAVEQGARLQGAMNEMQRVLDDRGTLDELQAARDGLEWAAVEGRSSGESLLHREEDKCGESNGPASRGV